MRANISCLKCHQHLTTSREDLCSICGWDFWFGQFLSDDDWNSVIQIHQNQLNEWDALNSSIQTENLNIRNCNEKIETIQKKLVEEESNNTNYEQTLEALKTMKAEKARMKQALANEAAALSQEYQQLVQGIRSNDALIKNSIVEYNERNSRQIDVQFLQNHILFHTNFNEKPDLMMVLQREAGPLGVANKGHIFIHVNEFLSEVRSSSNGKTWKLLFSCISPLIEGKFIVNFINAHRRGFNERFTGDKPTQITIN